MLNRFKFFALRITGPISVGIRVACFVYCIAEYIADFSICSGPSMQPTLYTNDIILNEHISRQKCRFNYGDIVICKSPLNPKELICKRITGLPGDKMMNYFDYQYVPMGHVWLEGDNRDFSLDSRNYGPVPQGLIRSRVVCRVWPLKNITMLTVQSE